MTPEFMGEAVVGLIILSVFLSILGIGGLIADYIFPHIPFIQNYLDSLPDYEDDEEVYQQFLAEQQAHRRARQHRLAARKERR